MPAFIKLSNTGLFAAWFAETGNPTPDGIRVVRSVLGFSRIAVLRRAQLAQGGAPPRAAPHHLDR